MNSARKAAISACADGKDDDAAALEEAGAAGCARGWKSDGDDLPTSVSHLSSTRAGPTPARGAGDGYFAAAGGGGGGSPLW